MALDELSTLEILGLYSVQSAHAHTFKTINFGEEQQTSALDDALSPNTVATHKIPRLKQLLVKEILLPELHWLASKFLSVPLSVIPEANFFPSLSLSFLDPKTDYLWLREPHLAQSISCLQLDVEYFGSSAIFLMSLLSQY
jgi:hypothetical protein